jgi:hypothetical protein
MSDLMWTMVVPWGMYRRHLCNSSVIDDIDDVYAGAKYLVEQGLADGDCLCIDGGARVDIQH